MLEDTETVFGGWSQMCRITCGRIAVKACSRGEEASPMFNQGAQAVQNIEDGGTASNASRLPIPGHVKPFLRRRWVALR